MEDTISSLLLKVNNNLDQAKFFYLSNDPERALGLEKLLKNYVVVHIDRSQYLDDLDRLKLPYFCWDQELKQGNNTEPEPFRSSLKLIKSPEFVKYFEANKLATNYFQTFKISPAFAMAVSALGGLPMNTQAQLNRLFEDKLSQYRELSQLNISLPRTQIAKLSEVTYQSLTAALGANFVVQFDRGHTGSGTVFINNEAELKQLQTQFPERPAKFCEFVTGAAYTLNACVGKKGIYLGGLSRQITGVPELTPEPGGTVGNDWNYRVDLRLGTGQLAQEAVIIGEHMRIRGYLGLFGLDLVVLPDGTHKFIEINARQPASIPMYTKMQLKTGQIPLSLIHIAEFLNIDYQLSQQTYNLQALMPQEYSQVFIRAERDREIGIEVRAGVYRLQGDNAAVNRATAEVKPDTIFMDEERDQALLFQNDGYSLEDIETGGFLILTPASGRKIKTNEELARVQLPSGAYDEFGKLKMWIIQALTAIKNY